MTSSKPLYSNYCRKWLIYKSSIEVVYIEKEQKDSNEVYQSLPFEKLAAGYRSIIAMIGDMLIRFYQQQPLVVEAKDLSGIVLIDELD